MKSQTNTMETIHAENQNARETKGRWQLIIGGVLLGTLGIFVEEANQHPLLTVWFRCAFGALALLLWGLARGRLRELNLRGQSFRVAVITGILMILNWGLFFAAISRTSIAIATIVFHIQPFWVMMFGAWFLRESVSPRQWGSTLIALSGLTLATGLLNEDQLTIASSDGYLLGLLMCLGGSMSYAAVTIIAKTETQITSFALAGWQCVVGSIVLIWTPLIYGWPEQISAWAWLAGLGFIPTGLAYVVLFSGMARLTLGKVALLQFVYPLTAVLMDWVVYGRALDLAQLMGVGLMVLALWSIRSK